MHLHMRLQKRKDEGIFIDMIQFCNTHQVQIHQWKNNYFLVLAKNNLISKKPIWPRSVTSILIIFTTTFNLFFHILYIFKHNF